MKKVLLLLTIVIVWSCSKQEAELDTDVIQETTANLNYNDKSYIETAPLSEQLEYKRYHLKKIADWLSKNDQSIHQYLAAELTRNNNIDNFFVGSVIDGMRANNANLTATDSIEFSLRAFENLDGESVFPRIVVINQDRYLNNRPYDNIKPIYAMEDYDIVNQVEIAKGYKENSRNVLEEITQPLIEGMVSEDTLMIISLGPCGGTVNNGGNNQLEPCTGGGGGGTFPGAGNETDFIKKMTIKQHKEPYPLRSDVTLIGFKTLGLPFPGTSGCGANILGSSDCATEPNGRNLREFRRVWVTNQVEKDIDRIVDSNNNPNNVDIYFALVIFERDNFPAGKKDGTIPFPNGVVGTVQFRSWDTEYHKILLKNKNNNQGIPRIDGYSFESNSIKYNIQ